MNGWWSRRSLWTRFALISALGLYVALAVALAVRTILAIAGAEDAAGVSAMTVSLGAAVGAPFFVWRIWLHDQEVKNEQKRLLFERFNRAVTQLGADREISYWDERAQGWEKRTEPNMEARLGAIYELESIAHESEEAYWPILKAMCAYLRRYDDRFADQRFEGKQDLSAIMKFIGGRTREQVFKDAQSNGRALWISDAKLQRLDMTGLDLRFLTATKVDFTGSVLAGADLSFAYMKRVDFSHAKLNGAALECAYVGGADMVKAVGLTQAQLEACFGDDRTTLPETLTRPEHWDRTTAQPDAKYANWHAWIKSRGHDLKFPLAPHVKDAPTPLQSAA